MRVCLLALWVVVVVLLSGTAHAQAQPTRYEKARDLYGKGKRAFESSEYQTAYDLFKQAYVLSQEPALLYNIASALQGLERPHDAAETLRAYVRLKPDDPDRVEIEKRITTLEEAQRVVDLDRKKKIEAAAPPPVPAAALPVAVPAAAPASTAAASGERGRPLRIAGLGLGAGGLALLAGGVVASVLARHSSDDVTAAAANGQRFDPSVEASGKANDLAAGVCYGIGGAALVTGVILYVVGRRTGRSDAALAPQLAPGRAAAVLRMSF